MVNSFLISSGLDIHSSSSSSSSSNSSSGSSSNSNSSSGSSSSEAVGLVVESKCNYYGSFTTPLLSLSTTPLLTRLLLHY